ncbi:MAG TPA: hypothetical protein VE173_14950, partial [Longimicrobiales bacterium]|nr:hypothetical protein [Longimicrobiales bacterium]
MEWFRARLSNRWSRLFLAVGVLALVAALVAGIADNVVGLVLVNVACFGVVAALTTGWTRPRPFLLLAGAAVVGFPVFVLLHNVFYAVGLAAGGVPLVPAVFDILGGAAFVLAVLVCPASLIVGAA